MREGERKVRVLVLGESPDETCRIMLQVLEPCYHSPISEHVPAQHNTSINKQLGE
jgi:hypothetical protein